MSQLEWISATCNPRAFNKTHIWALVLFPDAVFTKGFCWISLLESQGLLASLFTYLYVREAPGKHPSLYQTENKEMGYKGEEGTVPAFGRGSESFIGGISFWLPTPGQILSSKADVNIYKESKGQLQK